MKKGCLIVAVCLCISLFAGCSGKSDPAPVKALEESPEMVKSIVSQIESVVPIENARAIDDFSVENEMGIALDDLTAFAGDVTNNQADCSFVFVALCKDGKAADVSKALEAYRQTMTSSLYLEFAAKVEQAKNARIVTSGNYVIMVISGVEGPSYDSVDQAISAALNP